jgi:peptidoglycan/LPS O-acetylase OafA/YrhL
MASHQNPRHIPWIDWLRFIAAFMVVVGHARFQHFGYYDELAIAGKGLWSEILFLIPRFANEAVTVFFVLSGFLVGGRCVERVIAGSFDAWSYVVDRSSRIWLPLVPTVLITWAVTATRGEQVPVWEGIGNLLSVQGVFVEPLTNNTSLSSLSYEIWFYGLALGVALAVGAGGRRARLAGLLIGVVSLAMFTKLQACYLFVWLAGSLGYFLDRRRGQWGLLFVGVAVASAGAIASAFTVEVRSLDLPGLVRFLPPREISLMALGLGMSLLIPALAGFRPVRGAPVRVEALGVSLAAWSYSL